jgi:protein ImuB
VPDAALEVAKDFSPRLQRYGQGCVVLDVSGLGRLLGTTQTIGVELERACASRCADRDPRTPVYSVALAPTQSGALLLSLAHQPLTVVTDDIASALAPIPISILRQLLAGIHEIANIHRGFIKGRAAASRRARAAGATSEVPSFRASELPNCVSCEKTFDIIQRWGLKTLGELAALPADELSARLGQDGVALQRYARGADVRPLVPDPDVPRFLEHIELEWPIDGLEPLAFVLARMLESLSTALERADRGAAAIRLDLRLVDRTTHTRVLQLPATMRDPRVLRTLLVLALESHPPSEAIDHVTIEIDPAPGRVIQHSLLERARPSAETLATLMARLGALVGESRCGAPSLRDSYKPDSFAMKPLTEDCRLKIEDCDSIPNPQSAIFNLQSSVFNLQSAVCSPVLRRFRPPVAIRVAIERGRPVRVAIDRRGMPGGHVDESAGPWRSSGEWWADAAQYWNRDEWDVALSDGSVCQLFRERTTDRWFLEAVMD